jgi:hypothetical protein
VELELMASLNLNSQVVAARQQVSSNLGSDTVILELTAGRYFGVNSAGAIIWKLLQKPTCVHSIRDALLEEYEVERERCEADLLGFLRELEASKLIEVRNGGD